MGSYFRVNYSVFWDVIRIVQKLCMSCYRRMCFCCGLASASQREGQENGLLNLSNIPHTGYLFYPEDGRRKFHRNIRKNLPDYTVTRLRRL
jgi:hypothetical protein